MTNGKKYGEELRQECQRIWKKRTPPSCPCGFLGNTQNIREHRMNCPAWKAAIERDYPRQQH